MKYLLSYSLLEGNSYSLDRQLGLRYNCFMLANPDELFLRPLERKTHRLKMCVILPEGMMAFISGFPVSPNLKVYPQLHTPELKDYEILLDVENLSRTESIKVDKGFIIGELILSNSYDEVQLHIMTD